MRNTAQLEYEPMGDTLVDFHLCDDRMRFLMGPIGSAKTTAAVMEIYIRAVQQEPAHDGIRYSRWLVIRSTYPELETTTIKSWHEIFGDKFGQMRWGHPPDHNMKFGLPDGTTVHCEVIFMALDGPNVEDALRGMLLTGCWVNEINEVRWPIVRMARSRCGRFPSMKDGGPTWYGLFADTNMPDEDHWLYERAEEEKPEGWSFFKQPGGVIKEGDLWKLNPRAENLENLPESYYLDQIPGNKEDWIKVFLGAEYGFVQDGKPVYTEYNDSVHCVDIDPIPNISIEVGADFGLTPAAVIGQEAPNGQIRWLDELIMEDAGAQRFAEALVGKLNRDWNDYEISGMHGDPAGSQRAPTDEQTVFDILRANGLPFTPTETNLFTPRREAVAVPLERLIDGDPGLVISPKCRKLRKAMAGGYCFRRMRIAGDERYTEKPDKNHYSHVAEAGQYLNLGYGKGEMLVKTTPKTGYANAANQPTADMVRPA
jgi:hypothetical protein